jgi:hypothetical protein
MFFSSARTIVSLRDEIRTPATNLSQLLNSDIDTLAENVKKRDQAATRETLKVLEEKWPKKMNKINVELRKLITELGLIEKNKF